MHLHPPRRTAPLVLGLVTAVALLTVCGTSAAGRMKTHPKPKKSVSTLSLAGTWSGQYSGAFTGTFTLHWTQSGSTLNGSIALSKPSGTYTVTGSVNGSAISFGAVSAGAKYTGSISSSGTSMSGSYTSPAGGGSWSANKSS